MIRDPNLDGLKRKTLIALITQDVHNRDIVDSLVQVETGVSRDDFIWTQQLRFYMETSQADSFVLAKQVNAEIAYGYEYLGVMSRLVITPLTDRCWMTIIGALNIKLGAAPAGPAGTGKT
jgi:dynein heavy chain